MGDTKSGQECPVCKNHDLFVEGDYVDVGVGSVQCSPSYCMSCGWIESKSDIFDDKGYDYKTQYRVVDHD